MYAYEMKWFTESPFRRALGALAVVAGAALLLSLAGCEMDVHKDEANGKKKVEISTPFGDLKVKNEADAKDTGLPVYPAAQVKPSPKGDDDKHSVSMSLFGLKVAVVTYVSDDDPEKVLAWYREQMKPLGRVVECTGSGDAGNVRMDKDSGDEDKPVTCDKEGDDHGRKVTQLKLGTQRNQRIVAVGERRDGKSGSEFALVRVVLGKKMSGETL
jgi:hypothetical protein